MRKKKWEKGAGSEEMGCYHWGNNRASKWVRVDAGERRPKRSIISGRLRRSPIHTLKQGQRTRTP